MTRGGSPRHAPLRIAPGDFLADKYVVETVLGAGAMGVVVAARHKLIGQRVAIKLVSSTYMDDPDALARFKAEARALVAVQSENVVRVLDYGALPGGAPYLVMELLHGRDLLAELRARGPLPLAETAEIVLQACEGLAAVHAAGIVHRDVKPANLFLTARASGRLLVKIVDFGIAKTRVATEEELSQTGGSIGSPHYMSPEQLRSARAVDARSDVWSLGVTLYRALAGELPFAGGTAGSLVAAVMTEEPRPLLELRPDLPEEVGEIVGRALAKNADDRYASVHELADALALFAASPRPPAIEATPRPDDQVSVVRSSYPPAPREGARASMGPRELAKTARQRRLTLAVAIGVPLALACAGLSFARWASTASIVSSPRAAAGERRDVVIITDAPLPKSSIPEAAAAYQAALQSVRDGSLVNAADGFTRAAKLDPTMAAAELRSAVYGSWLADAETRKHGRAAMALRSSLSDRDRDLLSALEPLYVSPHPDTAEAQRRFDRLRRVRPDDAELLLVSTIVLFNREPPATLVRLAERMLSLDPSFAGGAWMAALSSDGDAASLRAVERCLRIAPAAASCVRVRARLEELSGDCPALEADARRMVAIEGASRRAYEFLATALFARGQPLDSVREALRLKWSASAEETRDAAEAGDEARLAIAGGDFTTALQKAGDLATIAERTESEDERTDAVLLEIELQTELGEPVEAARIADGYLKRMGAWSGSDAVGDDPRPRLEAAAVRGGLRQLEERDAVRREWEARWGALIEPFDRPRIWTEGYAAPAETRDEAREALEALPRYEPLPKMLLGGAWMTSSRAKVLALAGRFQDALPDLEAVTSSCHMLQAPTESVRAWLWLGEAREALGDEAGACRAYRSVVDRWGADPRSVTAATAKARLRSAGCEGG